MAGAPAAAGYNGRTFPHPRADPMNPATQAVNAADRLGLTLFLAAAAHGLVILGVGFAGFAPGEEPPQALDVVLVQTETENAPEDAEYLADIASEGGGSVDEPERPRAPVSSREPDASTGLAPIPLEAGAPRPQRPAPEPVLTADAAEWSVPDEARPREQPDDAPRERPDRMEYDARVAALTAEIDQALSDYAQRPRKEFVTARARQSAAATYMHRWVETVEEVGNLNYPETARDRGLSGALILTVAIRADGTLHETRIRASSGSPVLDQAAERIVHQTAPFEPFSDDLRDETDILYITRTWEFSSNELTTR